MPVVRLVNLILIQAIRDCASDIHFEPFEDEFRIRYRIDGALYELTPPPRHLAHPIVSRLKVLANLNIAERRVPQDGRIRLDVDGRIVDLRISTLPTQYGESVVLRVLDKSIVRLDLTSLGMPSTVISAVREVVRRPNGIFVVTGPTGSGKTTTLYSALSEVNQVENKILTAEDPVEYELEGIMQLAVNPRIGLTFSRALRAFLRQDPDKVMVGEIRDLETARIGVQASLTGHLVMSTLHTNDAPSAVTRLVDMGLEPYLLAASLELVLGQRLVRRNCNDCREAYVPAMGTLSRLGLDRVEHEQRSFFAGRGCPRCHGTAYRGRLGLFESFQVTSEIRDSIAAGASTFDLREQACEAGMQTLREAGVEAILNGKTSAEEVIRHA